MDRDYAFIGYDNIKSITYIEPDVDTTLYNCGYERIYLYNDGCKPWDGKKFMKDYINKYLTEKTKLNNCKNNNLLIQFDFIN